MVYLSEVLLLPLKPLLQVVLVLPITIISFFKERKKCPAVTNDLLLIPAQELAKKISNGEVKCRSVIEAYITQIKLVNPIINAVVEDRFTEALEEASAIDKMVESNTLTPQELITQYPLLGVPFSVKESIGLKNMSNSAGLVSAKGKKATEDADAVAAVKAAGGIPLLVSNTPELCLNWETSNNLTGTTCNPYDSRRTSGGSSGGEASLIASGASLFGLGSDIAGSLRLPAHFCGIFSHKPTAGLISTKGHFPNCTDEEKWANNFTIGPMARYASDLPLIVTTIVKPELRHKLQLNKKLSVNGIKIYYLEENGSLLTGKVDNDILLAFRKLMDYFESNHNLKPSKINLKYLDNSVLLSFVPLLGITGVDNLYHNTPTGNIYFELMKYMFGSSKSTFTGIMYYLLHGLSNKMIKSSTHEKILSKCFTLRDELEELLGDDGVLLYPTFTDSAHYHGVAIAKVFDASYMTIFNAFGLPVSNCPIGYNSSGMPMGLQVVAKRNCDRLTLAVAQEIETAFGGWKSIHFNSVM